MSTDQAVKMDSQPPDSMMTEWGVDLSPKQDKGVCKVIMRPGDEAEYPMTGDRVCVHYTGKLLNGKKFDSSRDRNKPFTFNLGRGQVIKAWDIGIASMKKGEVCQLMCHSEYAYGVSGSPSKIPPKSTLIFEIELLNFKGEELTEDGGVIRRIKQKGEGFSNPNEGAIVEVHLEGRSGGRVFDSRDVQFVVGEGEDHSIPLGVDRTMEKMQKGECCLIYLKPQYGFGDEGKPEFHIEPNAELVYQVTLKDFEKAKESWEMSIEEKLEQAVGVKHKGTQYFKAGRYVQAMLQYQKIVAWLEMECGLAEEKQRAVHDLILVTQLNLAMCHLRLREYTHAVESCDKVIELDSSNEKALYRRGEARLLKNEFSLALRDFGRVLEVNPKNRAARTQISVCKRKIREHHEMDKRTYANMFQKFAERDAKVRKTKLPRDDSTKEERNNPPAKHRRRSREHL
ncbi:peptidyl-prolyl cis-trans isomerase FKBP5-like [Acipenser oxyrinchus oxyrinchus]|uniref:peptidylprolyl isomerase n=1 Tax=Acipenser oxyrinchus oxyrinchus TaxID=40147 RepID=A0AAD8CK21_ACIOX|nr:peptidyl-prolyl cis-trans isomerase FKBP5-like [Acipenser oxyrinchus oxyrinchus]